MRKTSFGSVDFETASLVSKGELVTRKVPYIHVTMCTLGLVAWKQILLIRMRDYGQYAGCVTRVRAGISELNLRTF